MERLWVDALLVVLAFGTLVKSASYFQYPEEQECGASEWVDADWEVAGQ